MRHLIYIFSIAILAFSSCEKDTALLNPVSTEVKKGLKTENVIVLVIDGPRYTETWGEPDKKYIPNIANYFSKFGVVYDNFRNEGPTYTLAGHTAISTGVYQEINNGGSEHPDHHSIFQAYLKESGKPSSASWIISSKPKINVLSNCKDENWQGRYMPMYDSGINGESRNDEETMERAKEILTKYHPNLSLIQLREPDFSGHANDWNNYLNGIVSTDMLARELWDFIQTDSVYAGKTTLLITNDHGRHNKGRLDGFASHGDNCDGCRNILLVGIGPDFKQDVVVSDKGDQVDVPATVASMLGVKEFRSQGEVLKDLFK